MSYYKVLNIDQTATEEDIKKAYKQKVLEYHPDRTLYEVEQAREKFRELDEAYKVLSNDDKRSIYDVYHSHQEQLERNPYLNPKMLNTVKKTIEDHEQLYQKQSLIKEDFLDQIPTINLNNLIKIYDQFHQKHHYYNFYQSQASFMVKIIERQISQELEEENNQSKNPFQQKCIQLNGRQNQIDAYIQDLREQTDDEMDEDKEKKDQMSDNLLHLCVQNNIKKDKILKLIENIHILPYCEQTTRRKDSIQGQSYLHKREDFSYKFMNLINLHQSLRLNEDNCDAQSQFSFEENGIFNERNKSLWKYPSELQKLTKKQINNLWQKTQQKKLKQHISKKKQIFQLIKNNNQVRAPIKWNNFQERIKQVQQQISEHQQLLLQKKNYNKQKLSIMDLSYQKYPQLVESKRQEYPLQIGMNTGNNQNNGDFDCTLSNTNLNINYSDFWSEHFDLINHPHQQHMKGTYNSKQDYNQSLQNNFIQDNNLTEQGNNDVDSYLHYQNNKKQFPQYENELKFLNNQNESYKYKNEMFIHPTDSVFFQNNVSPKESTVSSMNQSMFVIQKHSNDNEVMQDQVIHQKKNLKTRREEYFIKPKIGKISILYQNDNLQEQYLIHQNMNNLQFGGVGDHSEQEYSMNENYQQYFNENKADADNVMQLILDQQRMSQPVLMSPYSSQRIPNLYENEIKQVDEICSFFQSHIDDQDFEQN